MAKISKNLKESYSKIDDSKSYKINEAIKLLKSVSYEKFDPSVELSMNLNLNTKKVEQQLRGSIVFPHGTGKTAKVLVVAELDDQKLAEKAGADFVGDETILNKIQSENWFDFDFIVTTPLMMPKFAKFGKILGPKGLMPNPKLGTVTTDIPKAVENIKKGQVEYRTDKEGIINIIIGKKSFEDQNLIENFWKIYDLIKSLKPSTVKGEYITSVTISSTMGPGIKIEKV